VSDYVRCDVCHVFVRVTDYGCDGECERPADWSYMELRDGPYAVLPDVCASCAVLDEPALRVAHAKLKAES
jgi:hypothetical protein